MTTISSTTSSSSAASSSSSSALSSLDSNFTDFLDMLMTQLQNQDPTSPMDTSTFTTELVQFSSVEQQIETNSNLSDLITLTQSSEVIQGATLVGKTVQVSSDLLPLQSGSASLSYATTSAGSATITVSDSAGDTVYTTDVDASSGTNSWTWDGKTNSGTQLSDGTYSVSITGPGASGSATSITPTVSGTVTGVIQSGSTVSLELGSDTVAFTDISSVSSG